MATAKKPSAVTALEKELSELNLNAQIAEARSRIAVANATSSKHQLENLKVRAEMAAFRTKATKAPKK